MAVTVTYDRIDSAEFAFNSYTLDETYSPDLVGLSGGGFAGAYNTDSSQVLVDFYDTNFVRIGEFRIPYEGSTSAIGQPSVTELANGNVLVAWEDDDAAPGLKGRIFDETGNAIGGEITVAGSAEALDPTISALEGGGYAGVSVLLGDIFVGRFSDTGALIGNFEVANTTEGGLTDPQVVGLADGGYAVTWTDDPGPASLVIRGRVYNADGTPRTGQFGIGLGGDNFQSSLAALPNGNWAVAYADSGWAEGGTAGTGISLHIRDETGDYVTGPIRVNTASTEDEFDPDVTVLANGFILVIWTRDFDVYGRIFDQDGNPITVNGDADEFTIALDIDSYHRPAVSAFIDGFFGALWKDDDIGDGSSQITGQTGELVRNVVGDAANDVFVGDELRDFMNGGDGNDTLSGGDGDDLLEGGSFVDTLEGGDGLDTIDGGAGIDTADYAGSDAGVWVELDAGTALGGEAAGDVLTNIENLIGSFFDDTLIGALGVNALSGRGNDDFLDGRQGDDVLDGGDGDDTLEGGDGGDTLLGDGGDDLVGNDTLRGGDGDDTLTGGAGGDALDGGPGSDAASFMGGNGVTVSLLLDSAQWGDAHGDTLTSIENLSGSAFFDELTGDTGANLLSGEGGDDFLNGSNGDDELNGGDGDDDLWGGAGADDLDGGAGTDEASYATSSAAVQVNFVTGEHTGGHADGDTLAGVEIVTGSAFADILTGGAGAETFNGGQGDDLLGGTLGADRLNGNQGVDMVDYSASLAVSVNLLSGVGSGAGSHAEGDLLSNIENVFGSGFADNLTGTTGANVLKGGGGADSFNGSLGDDEIFGGSGDDVMVGGDGADAFEGGEGIDWVYYSNAGGAITINMTLGTASGSHALGDTFTSVENLFGSTFDDTIAGDPLGNEINGYSGHDTLSGVGGDDVLLGGLGDDWLNGGPGNDVLSGYLGADTFVYNLADFGADIIIGFENGIDRIDLNAGLTFADFSETAAGPGTILSLTVDPSHTITILGVPPADIDAGDFV